MIKKVKLKAKAALKGNWLGAIVALLLYAVLFAALEATGIGAIFSGVLAYGYAAFCLELVKAKKARVGVLFSGMFKKFLKNGVRHCLRGCISCYGRCCF
jgi:uncharacterized membrane protein